MQYLVLVCSRLIAEIAPRVAGGKRHTNWPIRIRNTYSPRASCESARLHQKHIERGFDQLIEVLLLDVVHEVDGDVKKIQCPLDAIDALRLEYFGEIARAVIAAQDDFVAPLTTYSL